MTRAGVVVGQCGYAASVAARSTLVRWNRAWIGLILLATVTVCAAAVGGTDLYWLATEQAGTTTVNACLGHQVGKGRSYDCTGDFESRDGTLQVQGVEFTETYHLEHGDRVRSTLDGPDARDTHPIDYLGTAISLFVSAGALAAFIALLVLRLRHRGRKGITRL